MQLHVDADFSDSLRFNYTDEHLIKSSEDQNLVDLHDMLSDFIGRLEVVILRDCFKCHRLSVANQ